MSQTFRQATAQNGNVNSPEWLMTNLGVFQGAWVQLDNENLPDGQITEEMIQPDAFIGSEDERTSTSCTLDSSQTFWQAESGGVEIATVNVDLDGDALIQATLSLRYSWDTASGGMGYDDPTINGETAYVWDAVSFHILVDGTEACSTGWISDGNKQNGIWIRGCVPVSAGIRQVVVEARVAQVQYGAAGEPIYGNATNNCTITNRVLVIEKRKA